MKAFIAAALAASAFAVPAALAETVTGSGTPLTQERPVAGFHGVALAVPGHLEIAQGSAEKLTITGDDNVVPRIEALVEGGELRIRFREHNNFSVRLRAPLKMVLTVKALDAISVAGSGDVQAPALETAHLRLSISGSGNVVLGGKGESLAVEIAGSGDLKAQRFEAQSAKVEIAGSGDATVWARAKLTASVAGSGDVRYFGDPTVTRSIAGSGSVRRLGATPG